MSELNAGSQVASSSQSRVAVLLSVQVLLVSVAVAGVTYRTIKIDQRSALPSLRETPREVVPLYDEPLMVSDEQLVAALRKLRPRGQGRKTKIGNVDHNLRFWGTEAKFHDPKFVDGELLRKLLTDDRVFVTVFGDQASDKSLLIDVSDENGVRVRDREGSLSSPHDDHTLATLAEVGTPLKYPIVTSKRKATYRALVEQSLRDFSLNQAEYEWSALTFALLLADSHWVTSEGQQISFDILADRIMRQDMPQGVCMGQHRLHALVVLLRVAENWDGPMPMLSAETEAKIVGYLEDCTSKLIAHQHVDGFWNIDWPKSAPSSRQPTSALGDDLASRIIATGHALEWWSLVPQKYASRLLPPRDVRVAASQWLVRTINELSDEQVLENNTYLSHAGRALALWRKKFPSQVDLSAVEASE